jgi:hypothetical protein
VRLTLAALGAGVEPSTAALLAAAVAPHLAALRPGMSPDARARLAVEVAISAVTFAGLRAGHDHGTGEPEELAAACLGVSGGAARPSPGPYPRRCTATRSCPLVEQPQGCFHAAG